jgi:hydroxymethylpyrimidine pyrophosphatase-like HAD family hydrolase
MHAVPNSVAVANATPEAAAAARYHIGRCDEDGVAKALEELACATREGRTPRFMLEG